MEKHEKKTQKIFLQRLHFIFYGYTTVLLKYYWVIIVSFYVRSGLLEFYVRAWIFRPYTSWIDSKYRGEILKWKADKKTNNALISGSRYDSRVWLFLFSHQIFAWTLCARFNGQYSGPYAKNSLEEKSFYKIYLVHGLGLE